MTGPDNAGSAGIGENHFEDPQSPRQVESKPLAALIDHLGLAPHFLGDAVLHGADPVIRSPHRLGEASGMAQLLIGVQSWGIGRCIHVHGLVCLAIYQRLRLQLPIVAASRPG